MLTVRTLAAQDGEARREARLALDASAAPGFFTRAGETPSDRVNVMWTGSADALEALGLRPWAEATADELAAAIAGRHPVTGARVRDDPAAYDLAFIAPASLSWAWAQGGPELRAELERAVVAAAHSGLDYLVRTRPVVDNARPGSGFAAALALHAVGQPQPATPGPPAMHVHGYLVGVVDASDDGWSDGLDAGFGHGPGDEAGYGSGYGSGYGPGPGYGSGAASDRGPGGAAGSAAAPGRSPGSGPAPLRAADEAALYEETLTRECGALARAKLATDLRELGFETETGTGRDGRYFEIAGVPEGLLRVGESADKGCAGLGVETDLPAWPR